MHNKKNTKIDQVLFLLFVKQSLVIVRFFRNTGKYLKLTVEKWGNSGVLRAGGVHWVVDTQRLVGAGHRRVLRHFYAIALLFA